MIDLIFTLSETVLILSYLCRDILYLRIVSIIGLSASVLGGLLAGYQMPGMKAVIFFGLMSAIVNIVQIVRIITERRPIFLAEELKAIYTNVFHTMTTKDFMKIYKLATIKKYKKGDLLTIQDQPVKDLILIKEGAVNILKNSSLITTLGAGFFIGEMTFLAGGLSTATVETSTDEAECIIWSKDKLKKLGVDNEELYSKLKQDIAINLIKKIEHSSEVGSHTH